MKGLSKGRYDETFAGEDAEIEIKQKSPQKTQEKDTGSNHVVPVMLTFYDSDLKTVKERSRSRLQSVHKFQRKRKYNEFSQ